MLQAMHSPDPNDAHLRQLLDERNARADICSGYLEADDTPSVYSRAFFSPRQTDKPHADQSPSFHLRPRPLLDDPSSSVLDFGEDGRSSMALSEMYDHVPQDNSRDLGDDTDDDDSLSRISYMGPKMRFHSRAPWELEEDTLQEVDETESSAHGSFMGMLTGGRGKAHRTEASSSPRPSTALSRPSVESTRSFLISKRSFDTSTSSVTHPRGALYALAQESLSTSSLVRPSQSGRQEGLRGKFSLGGKLRSLSSNVDIPSSPDRSVTRLPSNNHPPIAPPSPRASCDTTSSTLDIQAGLNARFAQSRSDKGFHPYANPDLVVYSTELPPLPRSPIRPDLQYPETPRQDSNPTVVDISAFPGPATKSAPTPDTPTLLKQRISHIQGKDISVPVNILPPESPLRPQFDEPLSPVVATAIPGWTDRNINPGFSLISLEEARAQRSRGTTPHPPTQSHESSSSGDSSAATAFQNGTQETSTTLASAFSEENRPDLVAARSRARSISAGAKAKNTLTSFIRQPERRGSENGLVTGGQTPSANATAGKSLKHKKSGFMRLFGNGKVTEEKEPLPSLPSLAQLEPTPAFTSRHNPKPSSHRIPVPSLSPSLLEAVARQGGGDPHADLPSFSQQSISPRRSPPHPLSISTRSSPLHTSPRDHFARTPQDNSVPQSAPPNVRDFPALKLRPVSTLFSTHFGDHIDVTKLNFDEPESIGPKETKDEASARREENERQRQDSLASSGPSSSSAASFMDSQYNLSPIAPSYAGTALTTPTSGLMSPTSTTGPGPWSREREYGLGSNGGGGGGGGGRFSVDHYSAPPSSSTTNPNLNVSHVVRDKNAAEDSTTIKVLQEHLDNTNRMWEKRVLELEKELMGVKHELAEMKSKNRGGDGEAKSLCDHCGGGRGGNGVPPVPPLPPKSQQQLLKPESGGMLNRPRARTGGAARFVNGQL